jgi:predicted RNA-binding protein with RPS1 domain
MKYFQIGKKNKLNISYIGLGALHFGSFLNLKQTRTGLYHLSIFIIILIGLAVFGSLYKKGK